MISHRSSGNIISYRDNIYIIGGKSAKGILNTVECYNITSNTWTQLSNMKHNRYGASCCIIQNEIYVMGGFDGRTVLSSCERFNIDLNEWTEIESMNIPRATMNCGYIDDKIIIMGGHDGKNTITKMECYNICNHKWEISDIIIPINTYGSGSIVTAYC